MKKIIFAFEIGEKVKIKASGRIGVVEGLWVGTEGQKQYEVKYSDRNGGVFSTWFRTEELKHN